MRRESGANEARKETTWGKARRCLETGSWKGAELERVMSKRVLLSTGRKAEGKGNHLKDASESEAAGKANRTEKRGRKAKR